MADRCATEDCVLLALTQCLHCERLHCNEHSTFSWPAIPKDLPKREKPVFEAAVARYNANMACASCQLRYGHEAVAALPPRPELPNDPVGVLLVYRKLPDWYTTQEFQAALELGGGYEEVLRRLYPILALRFPQFEAIGETGVLTGLTLFWTRGGEYYDKRHVSWPSGDASRSGSGSYEEYIGPHYTSDFADVLTAEGRKFKAKRDFSASLRFWSNKGRPGPWTWQEDRDGGIRLCWQVPDAELSACIRAST